MLKVLPGKRCFLDFGSKSFLKPLGVFVVFGSSEITKPRCFRVPNLFNAFAIIPPPPLAPSAQDRANLETCQAARSTCNLELEVDKLKVLVTLFGKGVLQHVYLSRSGRTSAGVDSVELLLCKPKQLGTSPFVETLARSSRTLRKNCYQILRQVQKLCCFYWFSL